MKRPITEKFNGYFKCMDAKNHAPFESIFEGHISEKKR